jgi:hypothetical protein
MTRLPKSQPFNPDGYELSWITYCFKTRKAYKSQAYYTSPDTASKAADIAIGQKNKFNVTLIKLVPCPDSLEKQQEIYRDKGGSWDYRSGQYLYSTSY